MTNPDLAALICPKDKSSGFVSTLGISSIDDRGIYEYQIDENNGKVSTKKLVTASSSCEQFLAMVYYKKPKLLFYHTLQGDVMKYNSQTAKTEFFCKTNMLGGGDSEVAPGTSLKKNSRESCLFVLASSSEILILTRIGSQKKGRNLKINGIAGHPFSNFKPLSNHLVAVLCTTGMVMLYKYDRKTTKIAQHMLLSNFIKLDYKPQTSVFDVCYKSRYIVVGFANPKTRKKDKLVLIEMNKQSPGDKMRVLAVHDCLTDSVRDPGSALATINLDFYNQDWPLLICTDMDQMRKTQVFYLKERQFSKVLEFANSKMGFTSVCGGNSLWTVDQFGSITEMVVGEDNLLQVEKLDLSVKDTFTISSVDDSAFSKSHATNGTLSTLSSGKMMSSSGSRYTNFSTQMSKDCPPEAAVSRKSPNRGQVAVPGAAGGTLNTLKSNRKAGTQKGGRSRSRRAAVEACIQEDAVSNNMSRGARHMLRNGLVTQIREPSVGKVVVRRGEAAAEYYQKGVYGQPQQRVNGVVNGYPPQYQHHGQPQTSISPVRRVLGQRVSPSPSRTGGVITNASSIAHSPIRVIGAPAGAPVAAPGTQISSLAPSANTTTRLINGRRGSTQVVRAADGRLLTPTRGLHPQPTVVKNFNEAKGYMGGLEPKPLVYQGSQQYQGAQNPQYGDQYDFTRTTGGVGVNGYDDRMAASFGVNGAAAGVAGQQGPVVVQDPAYVGLEPRQQVSGIGPVYNALGEIVDPKRSRVNPAGLQNLSVTPKNSIAVQPGHSPHVSPQAHQRSPHASELRPVYQAVTQLTPTRQPVAPGGSVLTPQRGGAGLSQIPQNGEIRPAYNALGEVINSSHPQNPGQAPHQQVITLPVQSTINGNPGVSQPQFVPERAVNPQPQIVRPMNSSQPQFVTPARQNPQIPQNQQPVYENPQPVQITPQQPQRPQYPQNIQQRGQFHPIIDENGRHLVDENGRPLVVQQPPATTQRLSPGSPGTTTRTYINGIAYDSQNNPIAPIPQPSEGQASIDRLDPSFRPPTVLRHTDNGTPVKHMTKPEKDIGNTPELKRAAHGLYPTKTRIRGGIEDYYDSVQTEETETGVFEPLGTHSPTKRSRDGLTTTGHPSSTLRTSGQYDTSLFTHQGRGVNRSPSYLARRRNPAGERQGHSGASFYPTDSMESVKKENLRHKQRQRAILEGRHQKRASYLLRGKKAPGEKYIPNELSNLPPEYPRPDQVLLVDNNGVPVMQVTPTQVQDSGLVVPTPVNPEPPIAVIDGGLGPGELAPPANSAQISSQRIGMNTPTVRDLDPLSDQARLNPSLKVMEGLHKELEVAVENPLSYETGFDSCINVVPVLPDYGYVNCMGMSARGGHSNRLAQYELMDDGSLKQTEILKSEFFFNFSIFFVLPKIFFFTLDHLFRPDPFLFYLLLPLLIPN